MNIKLIFVCLTGTNGQSFNNEYDRYNMSRYNKIQFGTRELIHSSTKSQFVVHIVYLQKREKENKMYNM